VQGIHELDIGKNPIEEIEVFCVFTIIIKYTNMDSFLQILINLNTKNSESVPVI
jgi:hypothetical protein